MPAIRTVTVSTHFIYYPELAYTLDFRIFVPPDPESISCCLYLESFGMFVRIEGSSLDNYIVNGNSIERCSG